MATLVALWLPILLSAVVIFIASSILHMVLPYHENDYSKIPDEEKVVAALRAANLKRGLYTFPYCTHQEMNKPEMVEKYKQGPVGQMTIFNPGKINLGKYLGQWFAYCVIVAFFAAYIAAHTLAAGVHYLVVFRVVGATAFMAFGIGPLANGIWKGQPWGMTIKEAMNGLIYSLLAAGVFGWLWPR
jgi:hypothetical protein